MTDVQGRVGRRSQLRDGTVEAQALLALLPVPNTADETLVPSITQARGTVLAQVHLKTTLVGW